MENDQLRQGWCCDGTHVRLRRLAAVVVLLVSASLLGATLSNAAAYPSGCAKYAYYETTAGTAKWCWIGKNNTTYDRHSDYTVLAQRILKRDGWYSGAVDGDFGDYMVSGVKRYQTNRGLLVDGIIGGVTWTKLMFTSVTFCGKHSWGYAEAFGMRINSEPCGGDIYRYPDSGMSVRAYNKAINPYGNVYTIPSIYGPTAIP